MIIVLVAVYYQSAQFILLLFFVVVFAVLATFTLRSIAVIVSVTDLEEYTYPPDPPPSLVDVYNGLYYYLSFQSL